MFPNVYDAEKWVRTVNEERSREAARLAAIRLAEGARTRPEAVRLPRLVGLTMRLLAGWRWATS